MKLQTILIVFLIAFLSLSSGPCDETIGPSEEPQRVFKTRVEGFYVLSLIDNSLKVYLIVKNVFDETLQGPAIFKGSVEITSARDPNVRRTFTLTAANVISARGYDRTRSTFTFDSGDSIRVGVSWDFKTDEGRDLRKDFFSYIADKTCQLRCLAFTEDFILKGNIQLFKQTTLAIAEMTPYSLCFVSRYASPGACPPIITTDPCNLRPPQNAKTCFPQF